MRVSILINNYNYEQFVCAAIESSLQQTHRDVEVIVVDDGSKDGSILAMQRFARSAMLVMKANEGQASAYNEGFRRCTGDLVIFLDADDWLFPHAAQRIVEAWRPGVSKLQFPLELVDVTGRFLGRRVPHGMSDTRALELLRNFGTYSSPPGSGNAYDAGFLRQIMPIDATAWKIAADTVPIVLAPVLGDIVSIPISLGAYRLHKENPDSFLMNNAPADLWDEHRRITQSKAFVARSLLQLGLKPRSPMLLAPWEARIVALCVRFGDRLKKEERHSRLKLGWFAVVSLWQWPEWRADRKALQLLWMLLLFFTPRRLARTLATQHKASVGVTIRRFV